MIKIIQKLCSKFILPTVLHKPQAIPYVDKENHLPANCNLVQSKERWSMYSNSEKSGHNWNVVFFSNYIEVYV